MTAQKNMKQKRESTAIAAMIKMNILAALVAKADVARAVAESMTQALATTSGNTGAAAATMIAAATLGAIRGAIQTGCELAPAAQGLMVGILCGTRLVGSEVIDTIRITACIALKAVAESGGDPAPTATGLVRGAIQGAIEIGIHAEDAAAAAALGALNAVGDVRSTAYQAVLAALSRPIDGITIEPE